jgi:hypothetical protein
VELYTLISLVLGVSGGTYAALTALRTHFEGSIHDGNKNCNNQLLKVKEKHGVGIISGECEKKRDSIKLMYNIWRICHVIPAIVFFFLIFIVLYGALRDWIPMNTPHVEGAIPTDYKQLFPWKCSYWFLVSLGAIDIACVAGAFSAWGRCYFSKKGLQLQHDGVIELEKAEAQKKEAEKVIAAG